MAWKVMFRGDSRHPLNDNIFANGFTKQNAAIAAPAYRGAGPGQAGDLDPVSGVCVSARFQGAALFPLKFQAWNPVPLTFIYVVCVDPATLLNTHAQQVQDSLGAKVGAQWVNPRADENENWSVQAPMWPLFAHELAADSIPAGDIISAVECTRTWSGWTWQNGGTYRLGTIYHNAGCTAPQQAIDLGREFLAKEFNSHRNNNLPNGDGGFTLAVLN